MPDMLVVGLVALVAGVVGFGIALLLRRSLALGSETAARANADRLLAEARAKQKEIILEAKDEALKVAKTAEIENRDRRAELQRYEGRLDKKDEQLDQKTAQVEERDRRLGLKEKELEDEREEIVKIQEQQREELARVAALTMEEARSLLLDRVEEEMRDVINRRVREMEIEARERVDEKARDIITMAIQRFAAEHTTEHTVTVVALPSDDMKGRIIGREVATSAPSRRSPASTSSSTTRPRPSSYPASTRSAARSRSARSSGSSSTAVSTPRVSRRWSPARRPRSTRS